MKKLLSMIAVLTILGSSMHGMSRFMIRALPPVIAGAAIMQSAQTLHAQKDPGKISHRQATAQAQEAFHNGIHTKKMKSSDHTFNFTTCIREAAPQDPKQYTHNLACLEQAGKQESWRLPRWHSSVLLEIAIQEKFEIYLKREYYEVFYRGYQDAAKKHRPQKKSFLSKDPIWDIITHPAGSRGVTTLQDCYELGFKVGTYQKEKNNSPGQICYELLLDDIFAKVWSDKKNPSSQCQTNNQQ